jgi:SAM-dependent methyltransferase
MSEARYHDGSYLAAHPSYHVEDSAWKAEHVAHMIREAAIHPARVAEIGCGAGEILLRLHETMDPHVTFEGWDVSEQALELCRSRATERLTFHHGDLLAAGGRSFDLVLCLDVLEHVPDYLGFLSQLRAKGRSFIFHIPLDLSVLSVLRGRWFGEVRAKFGHLHYFNKETALATLETAGYRVERWRYTAGALDRPQRGALRAIARGPRRIGRALSEDLTARVLGGFSLLVLAEA